MGSASSNYESGHLIRRDVRRLSRGARRASPQKTHATLLGYLGYFGTYAADNGAGSVTHRVLGSRDPNRVGTEQLRHFRLDGDTLVIETAPVAPGGHSYRIRLAWCRTN